jgi:hypothetical protein
MKLPLNAPYRLVGYVNTIALREAVLALPDEAWTQHRRKTDMHPLNADVDSIAIRHGIVEGLPLYLNTAMYKTLRESLKSVLNVLPGADRIRLAKLKSGGVIPVHIDGAAYFALQHRLHIPLTTNPDVVFDVGGSRRHMAVGEIWEINNLIHHGVHNLGDSDRIHLVVDYYDL